MGYESEQVVGGFLGHPETQQILRHKPRQEHMNIIEPMARPHINRALNHVAMVAEHFPKLKPYIEKAGGSGYMGGSAVLGGSGYMGGMFSGGSLHLGGKIKEGDNIKSNKELYHLILQLSPQEIEMIREIAAQLLGGNPSPMWDKMVPEDEGGRLEAPKEMYDHIIRMPNSHAMARLVEADHGYGKGGGFGKALKHVARLGAKVAKFGHHALGVINRNKDLLLQIVPEQYKSEAEAFLETANRIDDAVNPIVDMTIDAVKEGATKEDKDKLKRLAENKIKEVVEKKVPNGAEIIKLAKDINSSVQQNKKPLFGE